MTRIRCPYCNNLNIVPADRRGGLSFITCDVEESAGCGKTFVINIVIKKEIKAMPIGKEKDVIND